ncbi:MAG: hypothetical protein AAFO02_20040, partial [Bacteroidota bacterium]
LVVINQNNSGQYSRISLRLRSKQWAVKTHCNASPQQTVGNKDALQCVSAAKYLGLTIRLR